MGREMRCDDWFSTGQLINSQTSGAEAYPLLFSIIKPSTLILLYVVSARGREGVITSRHLSSFYPTWLMHRIYPISDISSFDTTYSLNALRCLLSPA
jgi:hypothetical protein